MVLRCSIRFLSGTLIPLFTGSVSFAFDSLLFFYGYKVLFFPVSLVLFILWFYSFPFFWFYFYGVQVLLFCGSMVF